jgi:tetratricopeptide (TPR) repeat protein
MRRQGGVLCRGMKEGEVGAVMTVAMMLVIGAAAPSSGPARRSMAEIVAQIQKADYGGDRKALRSLAAGLAPYAEGPLASRALYWRGFAMWRRALNGFNDSVEPKELEGDLTEAVKAFAEAAAKAPDFVDAKVGASACLLTLSFLNRDDAQRSQEYLTRGIRLLGEAGTAAPENPRYLWVKGGGLWYVPVERGGGEAKAIETYERGLNFARGQKSRAGDPLEPAWGEPELLMNLAWSYLNRAAPDVAAAESSARAALALVPNWHYVRDILLPQIRAKATQAPPAGDPARKEQTHHFARATTRPGFARRYSARITMAGSRRAARRAGNRLPRRVMARERTIAAAKVGTSAGLTPARRTCMALPAA